MGGSVARLRFGVSRANGGPGLLKGAQEFTDVLGADLSTDVTLAVAYDYDALLKSVLARQVELAWLPPLVHVRATADGAKLVVVSERGGSLFYRSALLVHAESSLRELADLAGVRAAWVDPSSSSGYLFPRMHLRGRGLRLDETFVSEKFYGSAAGAARAVAHREADLCACFLSVAATVAEAQAEVDKTFGRGLRVLAVTEPIPPDGIVLGAQVVRELQTRIARALLRMDQQPAGKRALGALFGAQRLVQPSEATAREFARLKLL